MPLHIPINNVRILFHFVITWNIYFWVRDLGQIYKEVRDHHNVREIIPVRIYVDVISWNQDSLACPCHMSPSPIVYNHISPMHGRSRTRFITLINDLWRNLPLQLIKSLSGWFKTPFSWFTYTCYINMYIYIYFRQFGRYIPTIWEFSAEYVRCHIASNVHLCVTVSHL